VAFHLGFGNCPFSKHFFAVQATSSPDETDGESALLQAVADLPQPNRDTLAFLILHLRPGHPQYFPLFYYCWAAAKRSTVSQVFTGVLHTVRIQEAKIAPSPAPPQKKRKEI
jgi:hypothetical protein